MSGHTAAVLWPIVCATGHRPQHIDPSAHAWTRAKLLRAAEWLRDECGTRIGISGMARGTDQWWAEAVIRAGLTLAAYVPCPQQPDRWSPGERAEWRRLLDLADPQVSRTFADTYSVQALHQRNSGMLRASNAVVCVWRPDKPDGGTWSAVCAAHKLHLPGVHLDPSRQLVRRGLPDIQEISMKTPTVCTQEMLPL